MRDPSVKDQQFIDGHGQTGKLPGDRTRSVANLLRASYGRQALLRNEIQRSRRLPQILERSWDQSRESPEASRSFDSDGFVRADSFVLIFNVNGTHSVSDRRRSSSMATYVVKGDGIADRQEGRVAIGSLAAQSFKP